MLVKAKHNVKDASGWHMAGEVFETNAVSLIGDAVEVIHEDKPVQQKEEAKAELTEEPKKEAPSRRGRKAKAE